jgi:type IV fimbrial biogenesis protein FimT
MGALAQQAVASDITRLDFTHAGSTAARRMVILIGSGGMIRLCDPALSSAGAGGVEGCQ